MGLHVKLTYLGYVCSLTEVMSTIHAVAWVELLESK